MHTCILVASKVTAASDHNSVFSYALFLKYLVELFNNLWALLTTSGVPVTVAANKNKVLTRQLLIGDPFTDLTVDEMILDKVLPCENVRRERARTHTVSLYATEAFEYKKEKVLLPHTPIVSLVTPI